AEDVGREVAGDGHRIGLIHPPLRRFAVAVCRVWWKRKPPALRPRGSPPTYRLSPGLLEVPETAVRLGGLRAGGAAQAMEEIWAVERRSGHEALDDGQRLAVERDGVRLFVPPLGGGTSRPPSGVGRCSEADVAVVANRCGLYLAAEEASWSGFAVSGPEALAYGLRADGARGRVLAIPRLGPPPPLGRRGRNGCPGHPRPALRRAPRRRRRERGGASRPRGQRARYLDVVPVAPGVRLRGLARRIRPQHPRRPAPIRARDVPG